MLEEPFEGLRIGYSTEKETYRVEVSEVGTKTCKDYNEIVNTLLDKFYSEDGSKKILRVFILGEAKEKLGEREIKNLERMIILHNRIIKVKQALKVI